MVSSDASRASLDCQTLCHGSFLLLLERVRSSKEPSLYCKGDVILVGRILGQEFQFAAAV